MAANTNAAVAQIAAELKADIFTSTQDEVSGVRAEIAAAVNAACPG